MAPTTSTAAKKRKSDPLTPATAKKAKVAEAAQADAVANILSDTSNFELPSTPEATRELILGLARYARSLEGREKLANAAKSEIRKQMTWKPSCKTGSAKWMYDGVCNDPEVMGKLLGLDGPPTFKMTKMDKDKFEGLIGDLNVSVRYDMLTLTSDVNIRWNATDGTFKFSGTYGK